MKIVYIINADYGRYFPRATLRPSPTRASAPQKFEDCRLCQYKLTKHVCLLGLWPQTNWAEWSLLFVPINLCLFNQPFQSLLYLLRSLELIFLIFFHFIPESELRTGFIIFGVHALTNVLLDNTKLSIGPLALFALVFMREDKRVFRITWLLIGWVLDPLLIGGRFKQLSPIQWAPPLLFGFAFVVPAELEHFLDELLLFLEVAGEFFDVLVGVLE